MESRATHLPKKSRSRTVPILERIWICSDPGAQFDQAYPVAKRINTLLRHGELPREEDGAIKFWRLKDDLQNKFEYSRCWSDGVWKSKMAEGGGNNKIFQHCTDSSGLEMLYLRALQGHSAISLILFYRTIFWFRTISSSTFLILDVRSIYTPWQIQDWQREDKILAGTDRRYSLQPWIPCMTITKMQKSLIWPNHVLHLSSKSGKCTKIRCTGSMYSLLNEKDWCSIKQDRTQSSSTIHSQLIVSRKRLWWNLKKSYTRKCMCHLDHRRRFPIKLIGRVIWILMFQEAVKTFNGSNWNPIRNYQVQGGLLQNRVKKPWNVPSLIATLLTKRNMIMSQIQRGRETRMWTRIHRTLRVDTETCWKWSNKYGETRHGGSKRGAQHWFQSTRTVTLSCKGSRTSPSSRACTKDRKSSSSSSTSSRLAAE